MENKETKLPLANLHLPTAAAVSHTSALMVRGTFSNMFSNISVASKTLLP